MKISTQTLLVILLSASLIVSCKKNSNPGSSVNTNAIPIAPMDALYDRSAQQLIIYSGTGDIATYDLKSNKVIKQVATNVIPGYCDIGTYNGTKELYVPRSDGWLFIYDQATLSQIDQINIGNQLFSVVYNNGILFVSGANSFNNSVYAYSRATKSKISEATMGDFLNIKMIPGSNTELFGSSSYSGYYLVFDSVGNHISTNTTFSSPTASSYQLSFNIFGVYPDGSNFITTSEGLIISKSLAYVSTLPHGSYSFSSFDFDNTNRLIYAGCTQNNILVFSMDNYQLAKTIITQGTPQKVFYDNGSVISVSSVTVVQNYPNPAKTETIIERL